MRQIIYAMQFKGQARPVEGRTGVLKATTFAPSCTIRTVVDASGIAATIEATNGERATFESEVTFTGPTQFQERGTIAFGANGNQLRFETVGEGYLGPTDSPKLSHGSVIWRISEGEGQFQGASGLITSNFTVGDDGAVIDNHLGVIFVP